MPSNQLSPAVGVQASACLLNLHLPPIRLVCCGLSALLLLTGCDQTETVSTYTVPTHESMQTKEFLEKAAQRKAKPARMLAAIVPKEPYFWFFKLQGPPEVVANREGEFRDFLKSLRFNAMGEPEWTLPDGWKLKRGKDRMRFATLELPDDLETTVTQLPAGDNLQQGLLDNINRWRGQLDLPFIELEDLPARTQTIKADDLTVTFLNIQGKSRPGASMGMPPMAQGPQPQDNAAPKQRSGSSDFKFEKPAEWTEVPPKQFISNAFEVNDGKKQVSITLSRAGGSKMANIKRWRGQLGLDEAPEDDVARSLKKFPVGSRDGELFEIKNDSQTMVVIMIEDGDRAVFVKLMGDTELATRERQRFEAFAKSVTF